MSLLVILLQPAGRRLLCALLALGAAGSCATTRPTEAAPVTLQSIPEIEVKVSGASIETDLVPVVFAGRLLYEAPDGTSKPIRNVSVRRQDRGREPYPVKLAIDSMGSFSQRISLLVCRGNSPGEPQTEWPQRAVFIFRARGCAEKRLEVGLDYQPADIRLDCAGRNE